VSPFLTFLSGVVPTALLGAYYGRRVNRLIADQVREVQAAYEVATRACQELRAERDAAIQHDKATRAALREALRGQRAQFRRLAQVTTSIAEAGRLAVDRALPPVPITPASTPAADRLPGEVEEAIRIRADGDATAAEHLRLEARKILREHPSEDGARRAAEAVMQGDDVDEF
jgi:hypothetical protein